MSKKRLEYLLTSDEPKRKEWETTGNTRMTQNLNNEVLIKMEKRGIIAKAIEKIKEHYQPQKIILFGSFAWGNPTKDSDIDLLIVKNTELKHRARSLVVRKIISEENALLGIDILVYTPEEVSERLKIGDSFISKIFKKGKILYG